MTKGTKHMRMVAIVGSKTVSGQEAKAVALEASRAFRSRQDEKLNRRLKRLAHCPERLSVAKAMFAVERRIVEALWTLARLPNDKGIGYASRNGVGYLDERADLYANAVAAGGWLTNPPRPAPPSARAIDAMDEPLSWLSVADREDAKILSKGALAKRGNMANNIPWLRLRQSREVPDLSLRTLQRRYDRALRDIVSHLTMTRLA